MKDLLKDLQSIHIFFVNDRALGATIHIVTSDGVSRTFKIDRGTLDNLGILEEAVRCVELQLISEEE